MPTSSNERAGRTGPPDILRRVRRHARGFDVVVLAAVPLVLLGAFLWLPASDGTVLAVDSPSLAALFSTHYVHRSVSHLAGNLLAYALLAPVLYLLALLCEWRRVFLQLLAVVTLAFPVTLSVLYLAVIADGEILGFSALALALLGLLPVVFVRYLRLQFDVTVGQERSVGLFVVGLGFLAIPALPTAFSNAPLAVAVLVTGVVYAVWLVRDATGGTTQRRGYLAVAVAAVGVFFSVAVLTTLSSDSTVPVTVIHLLGYVLGFGVALFGTVVTRQVETRL